MAILQVSRLTQRKGLQEDLPQPLASAELGWSIDQRRLFIGNGTLAEGAPIVGNTEILTEFSDILSFSTSYTYQGQAGGYVVQTGVSPGSPISQSLQSRLDSFAIITDFGAQGDGATDDTEAINRALYQLYCVQVNAQVRRSLFFPAGVYKVSDTILIPPYARIYGDGIDASIISFQVETWVSGTAYASGLLVKQIDGGGDVSYYRSLVPVPALVNGNPVLLSDSDYWTSTSLPPYVVNTADSQQQIGANIGLNGAIPPQGIQAQGLRFATTEYLDDSSAGHGVLLLDRVNDSCFDQVSLYGPLTQSQLTNSAEELALVSVSSSPSYPCRNVRFDQCSFRNATYGINTDNLTKGITISNSLFDTLYRGVVLGDAVVVNGGPSGVRIMHNTFDNIYAEAVIIDNCSLNGTGYNTFYDVGNHFNGVTSPQTSIIVINSDNNISVGDMFQRSDTYAATWPRIQLWNATTSVIPQVLSVTNGGTLQSGAFIQQSGQQMTLVDGATDQTLTSIDAARARSVGGFASFQMTYTIYRLTTQTRGVRTGKILVCGSPGNDSAGEVLVYSDDYLENENCDVTLTVTEDVNDVITVSYTAAPTGYDGTIYFTITSQG